MNCPNCNSQLIIAERQQIEIDYCPQCRGVWLDRGELDKIIERSSQLERGPRLEERPSYDDHRGDYRETKYKRKREGFLGELFDF